jgi:hypothetical protein
MSKTIQQELDQATKELKQAKEDLTIAIKTLQDIWDLGISGTRSRPPRNAAEKMTVWACDTVGRIQARNSYAELSQVKPTKSKKKLAKV